MKELIQQLIQQGYLKTPRIIEAFYKIDRKEFVRETEKEEAYGNYPLPIGYGQTISQPLTIAFMLELLEPKEGEKILDVGAGSGYTAALLAYIVGEKGKVFALERIPELKEFGEGNVKKYNFVKEGRVKFLCRDGAKGFKEEAPFDKIHVAASAKEVPEVLKEELKIGGKMIIPIGTYSQDLVLIERVKEKEYKETRYPGFIFVPLITD